MKKALSITAAVAGASYLAAGIGVLVFQDIIGAAMYGMDIDGFANVYPMHNILQLAVMGIPCVTLGILSMSDSMDNGRGMDKLLVIYSSVMLVLGELLFTIGNVIDTIIVARTMGSQSLASMSIVSSTFGYIHFLINLSLVLLLLRGAFGMGGTAQNGH